MLKVPITSFLVLFVQLNIIAVACQLLIFNMILQTLTFCFRLLLGTKVKY